MADSVQQLEGYKLQLQQVEATLTVDPDNEELKKLKADLLEVILLTEDLINAQSGENAGGEDQGASAPTDGAHPMPSSSSHSWNIGDLCMAIYAPDEMLYPATIEEILPDGTCTVTFDGYSNTVVTKVSLLKPQEESSGSSGDPSSFKSKKDILLAQREYKRKKSQKKAQRMKQLEEERETEKNKWLDFNSKTFSKTNKGKVKRSIFATPDAVNGRVGVGTCGIGGRPMTSYTHQEKWTKK